MFFFPVKHPEINLTSTLAAAHKKMCLCDNPFSGNTQTHKIIGYFQQ